MQNRLLSKPTPKLSSMLIAVAVLTCTMFFSSCDLNLNQPQADENFANASERAIITATGQAVDSATNAYIPYARLKYTVGTQTTYAATDKRGKFTLSVPSGTSIQIARRDYVTKTFTTPLSSATQALTKAASPAGLLFADKFDLLMPGLQTNKDQFVAQMNVGWANGFIKDGDPEQTTNRVTSDTSTYIGTSGASLKIMYPIGKSDSKPSGAQWQSPLPGTAGSRKEAWVSYWVKPGATHDFGLGGKLPGLGGAVQNSSEEIEWSGKLMWRKVGTVPAGLEFYMHAPGSPEETSYLWNYNGTHAQLTKGQWNHIQIHYKLNTPGKADGVMEGWLNGVLRGRVTNFKFLNSGESAGIDYFFFSTFYGGNDTYAPKTANQYMWFDDVQVSASALSYSATTPKK